MIQPHTPEWYAERSRRITGSIAGSILGLSRHRTGAHVMADMLAAARGEPPTFVGNVATQWGSGCESAAIECYKFATGYEVHPDPMWCYEHWLSATPDGCIEGGGVLEVKSPYSKRKSDTFATLADQPHYFAQIQIEMFVTNRDWAHFYQWSPFGEALEFVERDNVWIAEALPRLKAFYDRYLELRECN